MLSRHRDCNEKSALRRPIRCRQGAFAGGDERDGLNLRHCGSRRTSGDPVGAATPKVRRWTTVRISLAGSRGLRKMSGSEFERENIIHDALSAAPDLKPVETREHSWRPPAEGLYDLSLEKDSCGVGFIANIKGKPSHQIISDALSILCNLYHL